MEKHDFEKLLDQLAREVMALATFSPLSELSDAVRRAHRETLINYLANKFTKFTLDDPEYFKLYEHVTGIKKGELKNEKTPSY